MNKVLTIGGDAVGAMTAVSAASVGHKVYIYEENEKLGKRAYITGKGWCNVTNACDMDTLFQNIATNPRFLYSSLYELSDRDVMDLLEECGCPFKTERGMWVFLVSDKSSDVIKALTKRLEKLGVTAHYRQPVQDLLLESSRYVGFMLEKSRERVHGGVVIVTISGLSYQATGSTGDGYRFVKKADHQVTKLSPALVPFEVKEPVVKSLQGPALKNTETVILGGEKELYREFGEMLFTYFEVSGPVLLSASSYVVKAFREKTLTLPIGLRLALTREQLDVRLLREFEGVSNRQFKNALVHIYPARLLPVMVERSGISPEERVNETTGEERRRIMEVTRNFRLTITGSQDCKEAVITQGGVSVKEVSPSTMESKRVVELYFAEEVLGLDAVTGGFNLQIAWSTGYAAGAHTEYV